MKNSLTYCFDDEVVSKFSYDMDNKKISIHFTGYSDLLLNQRLDQNCTWCIEGWTAATSKPEGGVKDEALDKHIGIFSMVLAVEMHGHELSIYVNTINNNYLHLVFTNPSVSLECE